MSFSDWMNDLITAGPGGRQVETEGGELPAPAASSIYTSRRTGFFDRQDLSDKEISYAFRGRPRALTVYVARKMSQHLQQLVVERRVEGEQDEYEPVDDRESPWIDLLRRPNHFMAPAVFYNHMMQLYIIQGHVDYLVVRGDVNGALQPVGLVPVYPAFGKLRPLYAEDGSEEAWAFWLSGGQRKVLDPANVMRIKEPHPAAPWRTTGVVDGMRHEIDEDVALSEHGKSQAERQGMPRIAGETDKKLEKEEVKRLSRELAERYHASIQDDHRAVPISHQGLKVKEFDLIPQDETTKEREFLTDLFFDMMWVPKALFSEDANRANVKGARLQFAENVLDPTLMMITGQLEFEFERLFDVMDPGALRINYPDPRPIDKQEQAQIRRTQIESGQLKPADVQREEGRDVDEEMDQYYLNRSTVPASAQEGGGGGFL